MTMFRSNCPPIPKVHHRFILVPKGKKLTDQELRTATKISVPRVEDNNELITITGTRDGIERARHEIQLVSDEQVRGSIVIDDQTHSVEGYLDIHSLNKF